MSDYLGSLVDRTLGLGPTIEPRLRSRFEPVTPDSAPILVEESRVEESGPGIGRPTRTDGPPSRDDPSMDRKGARRAPRAAEEPPTPLVREPVAETSRPRPGRAEPPEIVGSREDEVSLLVPTALSPRSRRDSSDERPGDPRRPVESAKAAPGPPAGGAVGPIVPRFITATPVAPEPVRERRADGTPPPPAAPVVHVTIGRVDVRARFVPPPPPAASRPAPSAPGLSLDEYLRRRNGDRR